MEFRESKIPRGVCISTGMTEIISTLNQRGTPMVKNIYS